MALLRRSHFSLWKLNNTKLDALFLGGIAACLESLNSHVGFGQYRAGTVDIRAKTRRVKDHILSRYLTLAHKCRVSKQRVFLNIYGCRFFRFFSERIARTKC